VRVAVVLFLATCVSVFSAGLVPGAAPDGTRYALAVFVKAWNLGLLGQVAWPFLTDATIFFSCVMLILVSHEMGHYLQSRRYRVPATVPYFIPMPIAPWGTMGAVILQGPGVANRKSLFDIAVSGPLAGLVFAIPITIIGIQHSTLAPFNPAAGGLIYSDPLLFQWLARWFHGPIPPHHELQLNAWLFAGWVGVFITALNLIPIGQLDGGHILYTLIGRRAHRVAIVLLLVAVAYMILSREPGYGLMVLLLIVAGPRHPPTADDTVPLGPLRVVLGWLTLGFIIIGFTPTPIKIFPPPEPPQQRRTEPQPASPLDAPDVTRGARGVGAALVQDRPFDGTPPRGGRAAGQDSQRRFMNRSASRARWSSEGNIRRQILVAAARSGRANPKASTISQPSYFTDLRVRKVVSQST
jgi:Zn-dependent protease